MTGSNAGLEARPFSLAPLGRLVGIPAAGIKIQIAAKRRHVAYMPRRYCPETGNQTRIARDQRVAFEIRKSATGTKCNSPVCKLNNFLKFGQVSQGQQDIRCEEPTPHIENDVSATGEQPDLPGIFLQQCQCLRKAGGFGKLMGRQKHVYIITPKAAADKTCGV